MIVVVHFVFRSFSQGSQRNVSTSYKIECGVFNVDLDEHIKLSMKGSDFVLIDQSICEFSRALVVSVIMGVFLKRLINQNHALSRAPSVLTCNQGVPFIRAAKKGRLIDRDRRSHLSGLARPSWYAFDLEIIR